MLAGRLGRLVYEPSQADGNSGGVEPTPPEPIQTDPVVPAPSNQPEGETAADGAKPHADEHGDSKPVTAPAAAVVPDSSVEVVHELRQFTGHGASIRFLQFTPDGKSLVSASSNDRWDVKDHKIVGRIVGDDNSVRVWNTGTGAEIHKFLFNERDHYGPREFASLPTADMWRPPLVGGRKTRLNQ